MAVRPEDCIKANRDQHVLIDKIEAEIDKTLQEKHFKGETTQVHVYFNTTPKVCQLIVEKYRKCGWLATYDRSIFRNETNTTFTFSEQN